MKITIGREFLPLLSAPNQLSVLTPFFRLKPRSDFNNLLDVPKNYWSQIYLYNFSISIQMFHICETITDNLQTERESQNQHLLQIELPAEDHLS